jgi:hypothetical protein
MARRFAPTPAALCYPPVGPRYSCSQSEVQGIKSASSMIWVYGVRYMQLRYPDHENRSSSAPKLQRSEAVWFMVPGPEAISFAARPPGSGEPANRQHAPHWSHLFRVAGAGTQTGAQLRQSLIASFKASPKPLSSSAVYRFCVFGMIKNCLRCAPSGLSTRTVKLTRMTVCFGSRRGVTIVTLTKSSLADTSRDLRAMVPVGYCWNLLQTPDLRWLH